MFQPCLTYMETYRSGHNGTDSKFYGCLVVSSAGNPPYIRVFKIKNRIFFSVLSCFSLQKFFDRNLSEEKSGLKYTHGELSERSKVQHSKCCVPTRNLGFESLTLRHKACKQVRLQAFSLTTSPKNGLSQTVFQRLSKSPFSGIISPFSIACAEVILEL